jgi:PilZ domain
MTERRERRMIVRVALSGTQTVRTHAGVEAHLLDLSLRGARVAHGGILRPGSPCLVHLPAALASLVLPAQVLWCAIQGTEWRSDGTRHLRSHSGLWFMQMTEPQRTILADILQQVRTGDRLLLEGRTPLAWPAPTRTA